MRKRYKQKLRSCPLCKPQKMGHEHRWKPKEAARLVRDEREVHDSLKGGGNRQT